MSTLPLKYRIALKLLASITDAATRRDGTVNRRLINIFNIKCSANPKPVNGVKSADITVDPTRKLWFRLYTPTTTTEKLPVFVYYHGGGFSFMSADNTAYDGVCRRLASTIPAVVVSVNYRLAPEHCFPAQFEDGFDVLKYIDKDEEGVLPEIADVSKCFVGGDSAGANIAHHMAVRAASEPLSTFSTLKIRGLLAMQPFFGGEERTESEIKLCRFMSMEHADWLWDAFLPNHNKGERNHPSVNVSGPNAIDISKLDRFPPTLVFVGDLDTLQVWQRRYYQWLKTSGKDATLVEFPNMRHVFFVFPELPESGDLISQVAQFVSKHSLAQ